MASVVSVNILLASKILTDTNISGVSANTHSLTDSIPAGESRAVVAPSVVGYSHPDVNVRHIVAGFSIVVGHYLNTLESVYTTDDMLDDLEELLDPEFYRTLSGVSDVVEEPALADEPEPVGNVIQYRVTVQVAIVP